MSRQPNWSLLAKYLSGEYSNIDKNAVDKWLNDDENNKKLLNSLKSIWGVKEADFAASDTKAIWDKINERISADNKQEKQLAEIYQLDGKKRSGTLIYKLVQYPILRYAAVFLFITLVPVLYYIYTHEYVNESEVWTTIDVELGQQSNITLSDGTKLILDAGSSLQYPETFSSDAREIKLDGEAYLEVAHDDLKSFKVLAENAIIEVLGTKFNVRNWEESGKVEVAVIDGRVALVNDQDIEKQIVIGKGFVGSLSGDGELNKQEIDNIETYISWLQGEISFRDASLSEVMAQIKRWYNVSFSLKDSTIINERLTISINKNSLKDVLDVLTTLTNTQYKINGSVVILSPAIRNKY